MFGRPAGEYECGATAQTSTGTLPYLDSIAFYVATQNVRLTPASLFLPPLLLPHIVFSSGRNPFRGA